MADPQPTAPKIPPKPLRVSKWLVGASGLFVAGYLVISLIHFPAPSSTEKASVPQANQPASQLDVDGFNRLRQEKLTQIAKKRALMQKELQDAGFGDESVLLEIVNHLPPCNREERDKLNGQNYVAVNQQTKQIVQFACESDDNWHPLPAAATTIQSTTPQQDRALHPRGRQGNGSDGQTAKEKAAQALEAALNSSSVVDFSVREISTAPAETATVAGNAEKTLSASDHPARIEEKHRYEWDTYTGALYHVFEGEIIEGILTNRLAGEFTGPVNVMVTTNLYSHDRLHILMPQGTRILGESAKVNLSGQRRLAVPFHRIIMPDGYSVDLEKSAGLDQQGAAGLTGRVDTHWPKVIATAVLVGAIGGLSEIGATGTSFTGLTAVRLGVSQQTGQEATQILDRALNILPTVTVYEGTRVRIWVQRDLQLPAYENHTISANF
jgi:type IV secretory pathway VirB10-like protein